VARDLGEALKARLKQDKENDQISNEKKRSGDEQRQKEQTKQQQELLRQARDGREMLEKILENIRKCASEFSVTNIERLHVNAKKIAVVLDYGILSNGTDSFEFTGKYNGMGIQSDFKGAEDCIYDLHSRKKLSKATYVQQVTLLVNLLPAVHDWLFEEKRHNDSIDSDAEIWAFKIY